MTGAASERREQDTLIIVGSILLFFLLINDCVYSVDHGVYHCRERKIRDARRRSVLLLLRVVLKWANFVLWGFFSKMS